MAHGTTVTSEDIPELLTMDELSEQQPVPGDRLSFHGAREQFERQFLLDQLQASSWNLDATAQAAGLERTVLQRKVLQFGLVPPEKL